MQCNLKDHRQVILRRADAGDFNALAAYWDELNPETRRRFAPHDFTLEGLADFYADPRHLGFAAIDAMGLDVVGYAVVRIGYLEHDGLRLQAYGMRLNDETDAVFAPSVGEFWRGSGLGQAMWDYLVPMLTARGVQRVILWGGVQADNKPALSFYQRNGFVIIGSFEYQGWNFDMQKWIR